MSGARVELDRGLLARNRSVGLQVFSHGTRLELRDITIRETESQETGLIWGRGMEVVEGAEVVVERGLFESNRGGGLMAFDQATSLALADVTIRGTLMASCGELPEEHELSCRGYGWGTGLLLRDGAEANGAVVWLDKNEHHAGLQLASGGTSFITALSITGNAIGVNIQDTPEGYDFDQAHPELWMEDNTMNVDRRRLPSPDPMDRLPQLPDWDLADE